MARKNKSVAQRKVAEGNVVRLRHTTRGGDWAMYFYDGELPVVDSVLTIPADRPEWIKRAWIQGFRMTAEGRVIADLAKHIRAETEGAEKPAPVKHNDLGEDFVHTDDPDCLCLKPAVTDEQAEARNAESVEETDDEGTADRGLAPDDDGVRSSEPSGDGSLPEGGDDGRSSDEPADGGEGDESAD